MTRTGLFRYVPIPKIEEYLTKGWMVVDDLGPRHGYWSVLMWRCDCGELSCD